MTYWTDNTHTDDCSIQQLSSYDWEQGNLNKLFPPYGCENDKARCTAIVWNWRKLRCVCTNYFLKAPLLKWHWQ